MTRERERLAAMAVDFPPLAERLEGRALRKLLRPWFHSATFDRFTHRLVLEIRRVPSEGACIGLSHLPGRSGQANNIVRRTITISGRHRKVVAW